MKIFLFIIHAVAKNSKTGSYVSCMIEHKTYMDCNSLKLNHACTNRQHICTCINIIDVNHTFKKEVFK